MGWVVSNNKYDLPGGDLGYKYVPVDYYCAEDLTTFQTYDPADPDSTETTDSTTSITFPRWTISYSRVYFRCTIHGILLAP